MADSSQDFVKIEVSTDGPSVPVEKSYRKDISLDELRMKLELLTGISFDSMHLSLFVDDSKTPIEISSKDHQSLKDILPASWEKHLKLYVKGIDIRSGAGDTTDGDIAKFELSDEAYEKRGESLRKFKMEQQLGRFNPEKTKETEEKKKVEEEAAKNIVIGNRVEVRIAGQPTKRGTVMFVGETSFKPGIPWVGVKYDEPLGKNDGSVDGVRYFSCPDKYGAFIRPSSVTIGDFPEEDPFAED